MTFIEKLKHSWKVNKSLVCVGLDTHLDKIPTCLEKNNKSIYDFNKEIIDAVAPHCAAFKPQIAYYHAQNAEEQLEQTCSYIKEKYPEHILILDAKRQDIGETAKQYAREAYERYQADAVTLGSYMGEDSLAPFLEYNDRGVFVLCKTSNSSASTFQDLKLSSGETLAEHVAKTVCSWGTPGQVGLVVGATQKSDLKTMREVCGDGPCFLVPGVGAQGGNVKDVLDNALDSTNCGVLINSSRGIIYAGNGPDYALKAKEQAKELNLEAQI